VFGARRRHALDHQLTRSFVNLVPLKDEYQTLAKFSQLTPHEVYSFFENLIGNILLFIPLPFIFAFFTRQSNRKIFLLCVVVSIAIETLQYILGVGITDIDDVILNSLGAALGLWGYAWCKKRWDPMLK
jgi:glycopeptide antibiotics resistance protein